MKDYAEQLQQALDRRGLLPNTRIIYHRIVRQLSEHHGGRHPATLGTKEIAAYFDYLRNTKKYAPKTLGVHQGALTFYYRTAIDRPKVMVPIIRHRLSRTVPAILTPAEVKSLLGALKSPKIRAVVMVMYGSGLRVSEACALKFGDIDGQRGVLHVRKGKGGHSRYTLLSKSLLRALRAYYRQRYPELSDRSNIIVIADEAHRSQYDTFARNLRRALPNAAFIGFTGTPLMAGEEVTRQMFGEYVSVYNFRQAIEDQATVPLYYENRIPELQLSNEDLSTHLADIVENADLDEDQAIAVEQEFGRQYHLITRDERLEVIAADLVDHFMGLQIRGKAMVIAIDKLTAVRMYDKVQVVWKKRVAQLQARLATTGELSLDERERLEADYLYMKETDMAVVVSSGQNELEEFEKKGVDIRPHRSRMVHTDIDTHFKDDANPLRIVFVCAMWLTGFDVPSCSTIYLDKPMRNHSLMQTIARANRVYPGKLNGLVVDYVGVFRNLESALAIYGGASGSGVSKTDSPVQHKEVQIEELRERIVQAKVFCKEHGVDLDTLREGSVFERLTKLKAAVEALSFPDEVRRKYLAVASRIVLLFRAIGIDEQVEEFVDDKKTIHKLAETIRAKMDPADISAVMGEVDELLDASIAARGYVIREPKLPAAHESGLPYRADHRIDLAKIDFDALRAFFEKNKTPRATIASLQQAAKRKLDELVRRNPTRRDLYEKLEELIEDYNAGSHNVQESFEAIRSFIEGLTEEEQRHVKEDVSEEELAIFDLLIKPSVELTKNERTAVKDLARDLIDKLKASKFVLDWRKKARARAGVRTTIQGVLESLPNAYTDELYEEKCAQIYEHCYESYHGEGRSKYAAGAGLPR